MYWKDMEAPEDKNALFSYDIAIAGGGMVGVTLALALAREGMHVAVIERDSPQAQWLPEFDGRVSAIALGSQRVFEKIGAWQGMQAYAEPILDIRVSDGASLFFLDYHHEEVGEAPFGWIVENRHIRKALYDAAAQLPNLSLLSEQTVQRYRPNEAGVTCDLSTGQRLHAQLLVAAEGRHSPLRSMAGIKTTEIDYRQTAIVCTIAHEKPHFGLAQERFLPAGPFAVLPMRNNRSSLVWVEPAQRAGIYTQLAHGELEQEIQERIGGYLGKLHVEGGVFSYPLTLSMAQRYSAERIVLVGDAAHGIHPIAGQGVNLGFRDVACLHHVLKERHALGMDLGDGATADLYQRWRRVDNLAMVAVTDGLTRLFGLPYAPVRLARGLGLWGIGRIPAVRRFFMRHAMGLVGDLPELMQPTPEKN